MTFSHFQSAQTIPTEVVTKTGMNLLEYGVLGTLLLLSVILNILVIRRMLKVQDQRVEDQKAISQTAEKMITTFTTMTGHIDRMIESDRNLTGAMQQLKSSMDTVMLQALSFSRPAPPPPTRSGGTR